jgi:nucleoside-diphosphate-sugar epimerase
MKIFLAGASGAIGKRLLPQLVRRGHTVTATTRTPDKVDSIRRVGATPEVMNALDEQEVLETVRRAAPDVIIHELTAIPSSLDLKRFDEGFAFTNMLRKEGTDILLAAARSTGCRRFIAQSYAGWPYRPTGTWIKDENDQLLSSSEAESSVEKTLEAILHLESAVLGESALEGFVLRYGAFYGPGTSLGLGGSLLEEVKKRRVPIVGKGTGYWSFLHIDDAASATVAAVDAPSPGVYNICDDEPAPVSEWLPFLANELGARPPRHIPTWMARMAIGAFGVALMTEIRGASNQKAKSQMPWTLKWPTWRKGFRDGLSNSVQAMPEGPRALKAG